MNNSICKTQIMNALLIALLYLLCRPAPLFAVDTGYEGLLVEPAKLMQDHSLTDHNGKIFAFPQRDKKLQLAFFGYTSCPDVCPITMHKVTSVIKSLGKQSDEVEFVFISIDNIRDKPNMLKGFVNYFHPSIIGLTGTPHSIKAIEKDFGLLTRKFQGETAFAYTMQHSVFMYLVDNQGRLKLMYPASISPKQIVKDVQKLLISSSTKTAQK